MASGACVRGKPAWSTKRGGDAWFRGLTKGGVMQSDAHEAVPAASASAPESPLMFVHVFAVAVTLALLWIYLFGGLLYVIVAPDPWMRGLEGIELVVFPLAWIAGLLLKWGSNRVSALRTSLIAPFLPLLAAGVLALIGLLLALAWDGPASWLGVARWPAAMLIAAAGYVGSILYPRLTAVLAGALVSPTLFGIVAANFISSQLVMYRIENNANASWFILVVAVTVALALLVFAVVAAKFRLCSSVWIHAAWSSALMLPPAVFGYLLGVVVDD